jgi:hypothetical protein
MDDHAQYMAHIYEAAVPEKNVNLHGLASHSKCFHNFTHLLFTMA